MTEERERFGLLHFISFLQDERVRRAVIRCVNGGCVIIDAIIIVIVVFGNEIDCLVEKGGEFGFRDAALRAHEFGNSDHVLR